MALSCSVLATSLPLSQTGEIERRQLSGRHALGVRKYVLDPHGLELEDAMKLFMLSGAHRQVMPRLLQWCDGSRCCPLGHRNYRSRHHGNKRIKASTGGRPSKVEPPTQAHRDHQIRPPRVRILGNYDSSEILGSVKTEDAVRCSRPLAMRLKRDR